MGKNKRGSVVITDLIEKVRASSREFAKFSQEQIDAIFKACAEAGNRHCEDLAKLAFDETGMGIVSDKAIKNQFACENVYDRYKDEVTCGVIVSDTALGITKIAEPVGVISAIIPVTNPTSTTIFKVMLAMKTRNGIILSPHPRAKNCTAITAKILLDAAVLAGAPESIIGWIESPTLETTNEAMRGCDLILATGGAGLVKSAYSSGKPAIGVGAGNVPCVIHKSTDIKTCVSSILLSKTFDNGMVCASEQAIIIDTDIYDKVKSEFVKNNCYILKGSEAEKLRGVMVINGSLNAKIVGQSANRIAEIAGFKVPPNTKILIGEVTETGADEAFAYEKLSPILAMYRYKKFTDGVKIAEDLVNLGGLGHTSSIFIDTKEREDLELFESRMKTCRILVNSPSSQGGIGDLCNFLDPSLTLGCGTWGGNSTCENVGVRNLLNIKTVAERRNK